jgi:mono/diheme cytochrome c family protein
MKPEITRNTEHADPHEQYNPVPRVVLGLVLALVVWAVSYIFLAHVDGGAALGDRRNPDALAEAAGSGQRIANGGQLFAANCQACHQASGQGLPGVFPPLAGSPWVAGNPAVLTQILLHGMTGPIEVLGTTYNGAMPAFDKQLNDEEIAAVASHIRNQWGNSAAPVEPATVADARKASAKREEPWHGPKEIEQFLSADPKP